MKKRKKTFRFIIFIEGRGNVMEPDAQGIGIHRLTTTKLRLNSKPSVLKPSVLLCTVKRGRPERTRDEINKVEIAEVVRVDQERRSKVAKARLLGLTGVLKSTRKFRRVVPTRPTVTCHPLYRGNGQRDEARRSGDQYSQADYDEALEAERAEAELVDHGRRLKSCKSWAASIQAPPTMETNQEYILYHHTSKDNPYTDNAYTDHEDPNDDVDPLNTEHLWPTVESQRARMEREDVQRAERVRHAKANLLGITGTFEDIKRFRRNVPTPAAAVPVPEPVIGRDAKEIHDPLHNIRFTQPRYPYV